MDRSIKKEPSIMHTWYFIGFSVKICISEYKVILFTNNSQIFKDDI